MARLWGNSGKTHQLDNAGDGLTMPRRFAGASDRRRPGLCSALLGPKSHSCVGGKGVILGGPYRVVLLAPSIAAVSLRERCSALRPIRAGGVLKQTVVPPTHPERTLPASGVGRPRGGLSHIVL